MVNVKIQKKTEQVLFEIKGHAGYDVYGKDIVCAAVSVACIMTANLLEKLDLSYNIVDLVCDEGYFRLDVRTTDKVIKAVVENLEYTLNDLIDNYPKYIKYNR